MLTKARLLGQMLRHFGTRWLFNKIGYLVSQKAGLLERRMKQVPWDDVPLGSFLKDITLSDPKKYLAWRLSEPVPFFFRQDDGGVYREMFAQWDHDDNHPLHEANDIILGNVTFFNHHVISAGFPPDWHRNYMAPTSGNVPVDKHWSRINEYGYGDIKTIWEVNRFSFVYTLVRAYWRSHNEVYAEAFWKAVENWREKNPPNSGINWMCGQEISFRVMAWIFGLSGFLSASATTPDRLKLLAQMIAVSGRRIAGNIDYALSQRNNHGVSEAMGLWTIGILFPEFKDAGEWRDLGKNYLENEGRTLIYDDGAFSQHSLNYHRLMLHDYLWAIRLGDISGDPFSDGLKARIEKAIDFLYGLMDCSSGRVPNYGHNDGSLILPLSNCDYGDYRPLVQTVWYLLKGTRLFDQGTWDEELLWFFGPAALSSKTDALKATDLSAPTGGYYTLRSESGFAFLRCASFRDRPSQADMLHADVWWRGWNVAIDAGTFSYNAPGPWNNALSRTTFHNTVTVDGHEQMDQEGRYLWFPWIKGKVEHTLKSDGSWLAFWEGGHDGYERLHDPVTYRRGVLRIGPEHWLVLDSLIGRDVHDYRLHWLLADVPHRFEKKEGIVTLEFEGTHYSVMVAGNIQDIESSLVRADALSPRGWVSRHYYDRQPALSMASTTRSTRQCFVTVLGPEPFTATIRDTTLSIDGRGWKCFVALNSKTGTHESGSILASADFLKGSVADRIRL